MSLDLIDDMENGSGFIQRVNGRSGVWYTYHDTAGTQTFPTATGTPLAALPAKRGDSQYAARFAGSGFTSYAALAFTVGDPLDGGPQLYDASAYAGLHFYSMGTGAARLEIQTTDFVPVAQGGPCKIGCTDSYGKDFVPATTWTEHTILFCDLATRAVARNPFVPAHIMSVNFNVGTAKGPAGETFDFFIDDVSFIKR
jgi:hypothetical protein